MDQKLKERIKELGEAINRSLSDSELIAAAVTRIKEDGYDPFLMLDATIAVSRRGQRTDNTSAVTNLSMGTSKSGWIGEIVRVGTTKPDGTPYTSGGKTGKVQRLLPLGGQLHAVIEIENDFIVAAVQCLEVLRQPPTRALSD